MSSHDFGRLHVVDTILGEFCTYGDLCRTAVASRCVRELMQSCQGYAYEALLARLIFRNGWETQSVAAVVSESYMVEQIKDTLELRHEFLEAAGLPTHHVLQNEDEIQHLLQFAKDRYHSDPEQKRLQERDAEEGGNEKRLAGKHARWSLEMQRRCGNKALWQLVCFTGQFKLCIQKKRTRDARPACERLRKAKSLKKRQQKLPRQANKEAVSKVYRNASR